MRGHTPGPWAVESDGTSVTMGRQVVIVQPAPDWASQDEARANGRLIAAAPDLLAACKAMLDAFGNFEGIDDHQDPSVDRAIASAREAVAKAEGQVPAADKGKD